MKIHNKLDDLLGKKIKIKILRLLFNDKKEYTGREIARGLNIAPSYIHKALKEMVKERLINIEKKGTAHIYSIKDESYIIKEFFSPLFKQEKVMYNDIISFIKKRLLLYKAGLITIAVFGSVARKEETGGSDFDIFIITGNSKEKRDIDKAMDDITIEIGNIFETDVSSYILTQPEIKKKYKAKSKLIINILNEYQLIYGEPLERVIA